MKAGTLSSQQQARLLQEIGAPWSMHDHKLRREFTFSSFPAVITFVNRIAEEAERAHHHPDLHISYNHLVVELWTHEIQGLSERDAALARRINRIADTLQSTSRVGF